MAIETRLRTAANFRDTAEFAAGRMRSGIAYRADALGLDATDQRIVTDLGVTTVIDLRTAAEADQRPDALPPGVDARHIDVIARAGHPDMLAIATMATGGAEMQIPEPAEIDTMMLRMTSGFATDEGAAAAFADALAVIADAPGAVVFHCTAGKDRTGWLAVLLHLLVGTDEEAIVADYLASNARLAGRFDMIAERLKAGYGAEAAVAFRRVLEVQEPHLRAALAALRARHGDVDGYLAAAGVDTGTTRRLRERLAGPA